MKKYIFPCLIFLFLLTISACSSDQTTYTQDPFAGMHLATLSGNSSSSSGPSAAISDSTPVPTPTGALFFDDFSNPDSGWSVFDDSDGSAGYENNAYVVEGITKSLTEWGANPQIFSDLKIDVDVHATNSAENESNSFGVDCRIQDDGGGYSFAISSDGYYAILKYKDDKYTDLVDWTASSDIPTGDQTIHLTALCQGENLQLWVNHILIAQAVDSDFSSGRVSLSATTYADSLPARVEFDNLILSQPE